MGWFFRKSLNLGPFRVTFSKSGLSFSLGTRGFRVGMNPKGRKYVATSIPRSGFSYRKFFK
jgi:hypothetical protein